MKGTHSRNELVPRRTQFSSCDSCRKSRVACDASKKRSTPGSTRRSPCTRCATRNKPCTFEWIEKFSFNANRESTSLAQPSSPHASQASLVSSPQIDDSTDTLDDGSTTMCVSDGRLSESHSNDGWNDTPAENRLGTHVHVGSDTTRWLESMYKEGFEAVFGSWIGNYSCPYTFEELAQTDHRLRRSNPPVLCPSVSKLCRQMDRWMQDIGCGLTSSDGRTLDDVNEQINRSLSLAIQAYSARWLPLTSQIEIQAQSRPELVKAIWREIRRDLLKVVNQACYRSVLTLLLFALTPIPVGIEGEEEGNGLSAAIGVHVALQQVQTLRARQKSLEFNGSKISAFPSRQTTSSSPDGVATAEFIDIESILYWAALTFDTSASLTMSFKPILSPGLLGFDAEPAWRLVRSCTKIFHEQTETWRAKGVEITEETSNRIIAAAASWKLLVWKMTAMLKEALREGQEEEAVRWAFNQTIETIAQFRSTYHGLLTACERRIQFLSQHTQLRWYELMLHIHLAMLIASDAVDVAGRDDLTEKLTIYRAEAEGNVLNCLMFGLNNVFKIPGTDHPNNAGDPPTAVPLVAIDPYPHHVVAATQLLWKTIDRDSERGKLPPNESQKLRSALVRILELLPQTSKSVQAAREKARQTFDDLEP